MFISYFLQLLERFSSPYV